ncbi:MAG: hypothetical protein GF308_22010 [Candidatus Heimdallarchaeota archaeon]|nr:hypothetical protein [Candidatus Heimdallarchaeota archaeon]
MSSWKTGQIRYETEQIRCENCDFPILMKFLIYFDAEKYPEIIQRILKVDFRIGCPVCGWTEPYNREIEVISKKGEFIIETGWEKDKIRKFFKEYGLLKE